MSDASLPKVTSLRVRAVRVPMPEPHRTASGVIADSPLLLVDVMTDAGVTGHAILFAYTPMALKPLGDLTLNFAPLITGAPLAPVLITDGLLAKFRLLGTQGFVGMAIAGIDMALWDAMARVHEMPLARMLGAPPKSIQAYGAVGYDGAVRCAEVAEEWARKGFRGVKAKIGYATVAEDVEVVRAIQKATGPDVAVMVDYNQSLTPAAAIERLKVLDDLNLTWVEEPTLSHDFRGHAQIAEAIRTPIQCGENWWGPLDFRHAIEARASDYMMPEAMKTGGVTGWQRAVAMAAARSIPVSSHLWPEISAQLLSASKTAHWLEYADWWSEIVRNPLRVEGGMAIASEAPGSGIEWDEDAVTKYLI